MKYLKTFESIEEDKSVSEIRKILERDCKPFLLDLKKVQKHTAEYKFLWRGLRMPEIEYKPIVKLKPKKKRNPSDTAEILHDYINDIFEEKFGVRIREVGTFTHTHESSMYGVPYLFFPIGNYSAYFSPDIDDLYLFMGSPVNFDNMYHFIDYARHMEVIDSKISNKTLEDYCEKHHVTKSFILDHKKYFDSLINNYQKFNSINTEIMTKTHEIIIDCKNYYLVNKRYKNDVVNLIYDLKD